MILQSTWVISVHEYFYLFSICQVGSTKGFIGINMFCRGECQVEYVFTYGKVNLHLCTI